MLCSVALFLASLAPSRHHQKMSRSRSPRERSRERSRSRSRSDGGGREGGRYRGGSDRDRVQHREEVNREKISVLVKNLPLDCRGAPAARRRRCRPPLAARPPRLSHTTRRLYAIALCPLLCDAAAARRRCAPSLSATAACATSTFPVSRHEGRGGGGKQPPFTLSPLDTQLSTPNSPPPLIPLVPLLPLPPALLPPFTSFPPPS